MIIKKFQDGGSMPVDGTMPAEQMPAEGAMGPQGQGEDPMMVIVQLFADGLQTQNCEELAQGAQMFLELIQQAQGGEAAGQPVFAKGGRLVSRTKPSFQIVRK